MKLYCYYTPSHDIFYDNWFIPTMQDNYDIISKRDSTQYCKSAKYRTSGWRQTQINKVKTWLKAAKNTKIFIGSDVDIQWFGKTEDMLLQAIEGKDISIQTYGTQICSGFFICRGNKRTIALWKKVLQKLENNADQGEQGLLEKCLRTGMVNWNMLPKGIFWTPDNFYKLKQLKIPDNILLHHATYAVGIENKIEQMEYVKRVIAKR